MVLRVPSKPPNEAGGAAAFPSSQPKSAPNKLTGIAPPIKSATSGRRVFLDSVVRLALSLERLGRARQRLWLLQIHHIWIESANQHPSQHKWSANRENKQRHEGVEDGLVCFAQCELERVGRKHRPDE